jgi:predicted MPP superfamily phosphohydrolase
MSKPPPDYHQTLKNKKSDRSAVSRRKWLKYSSLGGLGALVSFAYPSWEAQWLDIQEKNLVLKHFNPKSNLRLLHLSDLHLSSVVSIDFLTKALKEGLALSPDACFLTGDFITDQPSSDKLKEYATMLKHFAAKVPTFACLGNHDGGHWAQKHGGFETNSKIQKLLQSAKIPVLENTRLDINIKGQPIRLVGLGDLWSESCHPEKCLDRLVVGQSSPRSPIILLNHNPDAKEALVNFKWDLMLCGHTHGGQFRLPLKNSTPFAPVNDHSMVEGIHSWRGRIVHITRGVGNLYGLRLNCRPEISLLNVSGPS